MSLTKNQLIFIGVFSLIVIVFGLVFAGIIPGLQKKGGGKQPAVKAELQFWGLYDNADAFEKMFANFRKNFPEVKINFRSFSDPKNYEQALIEALASGNGPDIFEIGNTSLPRHIQKIAPLPQTKLSVLKLRQFFPQAVEEDFVSQGNIFALPLSIDTLALYYNRDILAQAKISAPPATWESFKEMVPKLVKVDQTGKVIRSAAAIGGTKNIDDAADILSLLMLQTGTRMVSSDFRSATFASKEGENALGFYVQFADPRNKLYTWSNDLPNYLDAFAEETVAIIFDYAGAAAKIKTKNPFLNFAVAPMPYPAEAKNPPSYGNYQGLTVSRQSKYQDLAWEFITQATTMVENAASYLEATKRPPALLSLASQFLDNPDLAAFAGQTFVAHAWPQVDPFRIGEILNKAIDSVTGGRETVERALLSAETAVTAIMTQRF